MIGMQLRQFIMFFIIATAVVSAPFSLSFAQDKKATNKTPKKTTIDFEDQLVEGAAAKPELFYLLQKRQFNYKRLIRLRDDFVPEMRKTSEDIQRKGSGN